LHNMLCLTEEWLDQCDSSTLSRYQFVNQGIFYLLLTYLLTYLSIQIQTLCSTFCEKFNVHTVEGLEENFVAYRLRHVERKYFTVLEVSIFIRRSILW